MLRGLWLTWILACKLTPRAENLLAQEKLRWLIQGNARECPVEIQKIIPAHPPPHDYPITAAPDTAVAAAAARRRRRLRESIANGVYAPTPLLHAPHAFSQLPVSAGCTSPRENVISSRYNAPAGMERSRSISWHDSRGLARASNAKTRGARYFYVRVNWHFLWHVSSGLSHCGSTRVSVWILRSCDVSIARITWYPLYRRLHSKRRE